MNIILIIIFSIVSAICEEKAILFIENVHAQKGLINYLISNIPALLGFGLAGVFFIIQNYFLKELGTAYGLLAFAIWSGVVVGLLLFEAPEVIKKSPLVIGGYILAMLIITAIQIYIMHKQG